MMRGHSSFAVGVVLGICVMFVLGVANDRLELAGELSIKTDVTGLYQPAFSGITDDGECYFAVTNTVTGQTELFGITDKLMKKLDDKAFQPAKEGRVLIELSNIK